MDHRARLTRRSLLFGLAASPAAGLAVPPSSEGLEVRLTGEREIRVSAPKLRFLTGNPLERLHNGSPVPFAMQLSLSIDHWMTALVRDIERFMLSYDVWEERFSAVKLGHPRRSASHLAARAAESWCVAEMMLGTPGVSENQAFWLRLDVRAEDPSEENPEASDAMSLTRLIELFSRRARADQARWTADAGPLRISDLRHAPGATR